MKTGGEGKFFSFKVVLGGTSLFKMNHGPAGLDCLQLVCRFYWSTGAADGNSSWWIQGQISEEKSLKTFFCVCV